jgi:hypothetical protein
MTQPDAHQSRALFRDRLLVKFLILPASSQRLYVRWRDQAQGSRAALATYLVQLPEGHAANGGFAAGASAEDFVSALKRAGLRV